MGRQKDLLEVVEHAYPKVPYKLTDRQTDRQLSIQADEDLDSGQTGRQRDLLEVVEHAGLRMLRQLGDGPVLQKPHAPGTERQH